jgi:hypothetical protein
MPTSLERIRAARGAGTASPSNSLDRVRAARGVSQPQGGGGWQAVPGATVAAAVTPWDAYVDAAREAGEFLLDDLPEALGPYTRVLSRGITRVPESIIPQPSASDYAQVGTDVALTATGSALARGAGHVASEVAKWFGRGGRMRGAATDTMRAVEANDETLRARAVSQGRAPGEPRFVPEGAPKATTFGQEVVRPSLTGGAIAGATGLGVDYLDPSGLASGHDSEAADAVVGGGLGAATGGIALRQQLTEIMIRNPRYRALMMRPSPANRSAAVGALLGFLASKGIQAGYDLVNSAVDDAAAVVRDVEQTREETSAPRRTSIGPDAIPQPRWGRR